MKKYLSILTTLALSTSAILSSSSLLNSYVKKSNLIEIYNLNNVVQSINIIEVPFFANKGKTITKSFEKNAIIAFSDPSKLIYN